MQNNEIKSMLASVILHSVAILFFLFYFVNKPVIKKEPEMITLKLESITITKQEDTKPKQPIIPKKVEPPKVVEKKVIAIQKSQSNKDNFITKPIEKEKEIVKKIIETPKKETTKQETKQSNTEKIKEPNKTDESKKENFSKANFETIRGKVLANLVYPKMAERMGWEGVTHVRLIIDSNGRLTDVIMTKSSGKKILDEAAMNAANALRGQTLPKSEDTATVNLPISFDKKDDN